MDCATADSLRCLRQIAGARRPLMGKNAQIVRLEVPDHPRENVRLRGCGDEFAWPQDELVLRDAGSYAMKKLRGVPRERFARGIRTVKGAAAIAVLNRALVAARCHLKRRHEAPQPIQKLMPVNLVIRKMKNSKPLPLRRLKELLGEEDAAEFWERLKRFKAQRTR